MHKHISKGCTKAALALLLITFLNIYSLTMPEQEVKSPSIAVLYTNWRGQTAIRTIIPKKIYFGSTQFHTEPQWLLTVFDCDRRAERIYALKDIKKWFVAPQGHTDRKEKKHL